jgi:hypothetical protein
MAGGSSWGGWRWPCLDGKRIVLEQLAGEKDKGLFAATAHDYIVFALPQKEGFPCFCRLHAVTARRSDGVGICAKNRGVSSFLFSDAPVTMG